MIIYGPSLSPYVRKTLVFAQEKGLNFENPPTPPGSMDAAFRETSPFGKVPGFRHGDFLLSDSSAIVAYLDALGNGPKLIPDDAKARARTIWWDEFADTILSGTGVKLFFNRIVAPKFLKTDGDIAAADQAQQQELPPILDYLERSLGGAPYLVGDALTLADIAVASPCVNLLHLGVEIDTKVHPNLAAYVERILARTAFATIIEREKLFLGQFGVQSSA
jgi:glutathione S-transferase